MKVALYHPWIYLKGGLERTILEIGRRSRHEWLIYTSHYDAAGTFPEMAGLQVREAQRVSVQRSYGAFRQDFGPSFTLDEATGELRDWGPKLNDNFTAVDKFAATTGGVATVFARQGDDFVRITTSLKKATSSAAAIQRLHRRWPASPTPDAPFCSDVPT